MLITIYHQLFVDLLLILTVEGEIKAAMLPTSTVPVPARDDSSTRETTLAENSSHEISFYNDKEWWLFAEDTITPAVLNNSVNDTTYLSSPVASPATIAILSSLFFFIGVVGTGGNFLVIYVIITDKEMRRSETNLLIMNLAISDFIIMIVCVPEIIQFMMNKGWCLGLILCRILRFTQVFSLYASVMTLVSVCVERYIAIIHPLKMHLFRCRSRIMLVIIAIWPTSMIMASPNLLFNVIEVVRPDFTPCQMRYPHPTDEVLVKYSEFILFYVIPLVLQIILYTRIGKRLFNNDDLHRIEPKYSAGKTQESESMRARRGVIKMLIAGVVMYFVCFSPIQGLLIYNTFIGGGVHETWALIIFFNIMIYMSSASNPLLYSIFSQKFRRKFGRVLCWKSSISTTISRSSKNSRSASRMKSFKTSVSEV